MEKVSPFLDSLNRLRKDAERAGRLAGKARGSGAEQLRAACRAVRDAARAAQEQAAREVQEARQALLDTEARMSAIVATAVDAIIVIDERGIVHSANPAVEKMFGYQEAELIGRNVALLMAEPDAGLHDSYIRHYLATGEKKIIGIGRRVTARRHDGEVFPVDLAVSEVQSGAQRLFTGVVRDVSQQTRDEEELRRERDKAVMYLDIAAVIIMVVDHQERVSLINRAGCELLGQREEEIVGSNWFDRFLPDAVREETRVLFQRIVRGEQEIPQQLRVSVVGRGGQPRLIEWHNTVIRDAQGRISATLSSGLDVTEQDRLTRALLEQESLVRLGEMAAVVAHEVKNPLAGISGALQVFARRLPAADASQEVMREILDRLQALNERVDDLLFFARPRLPRLGPVPILTLLRTVAESFGRDPGQAGVAIEVQGAEVTVWGDADLLQPVFLNLLVNSSQAMNGRGRIALAVAVERAARIALITVHDGGPGIAPELRSKVFEPFFTTKSRGTGLGLPIARRIVEMHKGTIELQFPPDGGTKVLIALPLAPAARKARR